MRYTQDVGIQASTGDTRKPEKIEMMYVAEAAITVGKGVMISTATTEPYGSQVLTCTAARGHTTCGVYEGQSESRGAATTVSGLAGYNAVAGETIFVTVHGPAVGLVFETTTVTTTGSVTAGDGLTYGLGAGAGIAVRGADPATTLAAFVAPVIALETQTLTATTGSATDIYVRFM